MSLARRTLLTAVGASLLARPARGAIPIPLPFGGGGRPGAPKVDLAAILRETGAPALAAAVVTAKGFAFREVAGRRRADRPDPVTRDDLWRLGSNTQAMTAALYARYVEAGRASWGARLPALLTDLKLHADWGEVRIDDVLAHRSGITDRGLLDPAFLAGARASKLSPRDARTDIVKTLLAAPPAGPTGGFDDAYLNYGVAGAVIERIAFKPFELAMAADLFRPLGMTRMGFGAPPGAAPWGHAVEGGGLVAVDPATPSDVPPVLYPAGGVSGSLDDYARFLRLFLTEGAHVLKPETLRRLARPWSGGDGQQGVGAWRIDGNRPWAQGPVLEHEGSNALWHASATVAPGRGLAVIAFANAEGGGGAEACRRASLALVKAYA